MGREEGGGFRMGNKMYNYCVPLSRLGFPGSSEVKASACNAGDPGSIPGLGRPRRVGVQKGLVGYSLELQRVCAKPLSTNIDNGLPVCQALFLPGFVLNAVSNEVG